MDVILNRKWEGIVDDSSDIRDIQSSRRNVRSHQQRRLARLELQQSLHTCVLVHVSVQSCNFEAFTPEHTFHAVGFFLVEGEDEDTGGLGRFGVLW